MQQLPENLTGLGGLGQQGPQTAMSAAEGYQDPDAIPEGAEAADPKEQKLYEAIVRPAANFLFPAPGNAKAERALKGIVSAMEQQGDVRAGIATTVRGLVGRSLQELRDRGLRKVPADVLFNAIQEVAAHTMEIAEGAGLLDMNDQQMVEGSLIRAVDQAREQAQSMGMIDKDEVDRDFQEFLRISGGEQPSETPDSAPVGAMGGEPREGGGGMPEEQAPPLSRSQKARMRRRNAKGATA